MVPLSVRRTEAAMTLIETLVVVAIVTLVLGALGAFFLGRKPYALRASFETVAALVSDARALAQTSGKGATVVLDSDGTGGFRAALYPYRPIAGADLGAPALRTAGGGVKLAPLPLAIFISSSATASSSAWTPSSGTLENEPACNDAFALTFDDGSREETHTIACADATLR